MTFRKTSLQVRAAVLLPVSLAMLFASPLFTAAQESQWIWSPRQDSNTVQRTDCYFRKKFTLVRPEDSELIIAAGDRYELYINGKLASHGESYGNADKMDATILLQPGVNLIAVKVQHFDNSQAGLAMKLRIKEKGETRWRSLVTDESWKTRVEGVEEWKSTGYDDMGWLTAQVVGEASLGRPMHVGPASENQAETAQSEKLPPPKVEAPQKQGLQERFDISNEFTVQQVMLEEETGSLIAMAFNEFGKLILSREGGPLLIADPSKPMKDPNRIRVLCNQVNTCQGILPLNGDVYVTGNGPDGLAVYHLSDANRDGVMEVAGTIAKFTGELGEHGPHGLILGNDGMIYVVIGNGSHVDGETADTSPFQHTYEGDLVSRYEDPGGHAVGIKAPGGTIVRMTLDGSRVETVAGGLRNCYDLAFNADGELFTHDSDMESDMGMSWYWPTKVFHVPDGGEFGWRSGWAQIPRLFYGSNSLRQ